MQSSGQERSYYKLQNLPACECWQCELTGQTHKKMLTVISSKKGLVLQSKRKLLLLCTLFSSQLFTMCKKIFFVVF